MIQQLASGANGIAHTELTRPVQLVGTGVDQLPVLFWFGVLRANRFAPIVLAGLRASPSAGSFHGCFLVSTGFSSRSNTRWRDGKRVVGSWLVWAVMIAEVRGPVMAIDSGCRHKKKERILGQGKK